MYKSHVPHGTRKSSYWHLEFQELHVIIHETIELKQYENEKSNAFVIGPGNIISCLFAYSDSCCGTTNWAEWRRRAAKVN